MSVQKPVITTVTIGAEHIDSLQECIRSKRDYAEKHEYTFIEGDSRFWNRKRPISWSKIPFLLHVCSTVPDGTLIWQSDINVLVTNPELTIEGHLAPLLPDTKDILLTLDSFGKMNNGSMLCRNTPWFRDFLARTYALTQFTFHPQREAEAMLVLSKNPSDAVMIELINKPTHMNSYLSGLPGEPLWTPGDFIVHFVGVTDLKELEPLIEQCLAGKTPRL
jgi:hypothetical protein